MTLNYLDTSGDFPKLQAAGHTVVYSLLPLSPTTPNILTHRNEVGGVVGPLTGGGSDGGPKGDRVNTGVWRERGGGAPCTTGLLHGWHSAGFLCTGFCIESSYQCEIESKVFFF